MGEKPFLDPCFLPYLCQLSFENLIWCLKETRLRYSKVYRSIQEKDRRSLLQRAVFLSGNIREGGL